MTRDIVGVALSVALALIAFAAHGADDYRLLRLDGHLVKWGNLRLGTPATVTYAYVSKPMRFPGARNCREMVPMDGLLAASGIRPARFVQETEAAFAMWEAVAGITFRRSANPARADIMIGAQATPRQRAFADVSHAAFTANGVSRIDRSLICLNPLQPWAVGFGDQDDAYDLRYVIMHEAGHTIGLDHSRGHDQVMSFRYPRQFRGLQPGDIAGAVNLYGKPDPTTPALLQVGAEPANVTVHAAD